MTDSQIQWEKKFKVNTTLGTFVFIYVILKDHIDKPCFTKFQTDISNRRRHNQNSAERYSAWRLFGAQRGKRQLDAKVHKCILVISPGFY